MGIRWILSLGENGRETIIKIQVVALLKKGNCEDQDIDEFKMIGEIGRINDIEGQRGSLTPGVALTVVLNIEIDLRTTSSIIVNSCLC